jgi:hypothetical protein
LSRKFLLIVAAAVAVGSFLPWVSVLGISVSGINGDGVITLVVAVAGAILAAIERPRSVRFAKGVHATLGVLVTIVAGYHLGGFAAVGVYVTMLAGLAWVGLALVPALSTRAEANHA